MAGQCKRGQNEPVAPTSASWDNGARIPRAVVPRNSAGAAARGSAPGSRSGPR